MAWDPEAGRLLVFGGRVRELERYRGCGDLWSWDGERWTRLH